MKILVVGANGGIGLAILHALRARYPAAELFGTWHSNHPASSICSWYQLDASNDLQVAALAKRFDRIDWIINAVGFLHSESAGPEKTVRDFEPEFFMQNIRLNTLPTLLLAKYFMPLVKSSKAAVFATISAKVGSIEDNRLGGWVSYRSSKAALNMAIKTISIEWQRKCPEVCVVALHPGTTDTALSQPFHSNVPSKSLFSAEQTAAYLLERLESLDPQQTGKFYAFDGEELPW